MKKQVLFIQGAGEGAHVEDGELVKSLRGELGAEFAVHYPKMPNDGDAEYELIKERISKELATLESDVIFVAHSAGAAALVKFLSRRRCHDTDLRHIPYRCPIRRPWWLGH